MSRNIVNVAEHLRAAAEASPYRPAIIYPVGRDAGGRSTFTQLSYEQLNQAVDRYALGLAGFGLKPGQRTMMMVTPGIDFIAITFALMRMGAVPVFIDPGQPRGDLLQCIKDTEPTAFVGIPKAYLLRLLVPGAFRAITHWVTVGKKRYLGQATLEELSRNQQGPCPVGPTTAESEGAVAFTSGSTGIPKGVVYLHGMFEANIRLLRDGIGYSEDLIDLPCLPILALFNPAFGITTVFPNMDFSHPATVDPAYLVDAIQTHGVSTSFGSPTIWKKVVPYCQANNIKLPSLKRIIMAGAPVPPDLIEATEEILVNGQVMTPFGATEALPLTNMRGREILEETAALSDQGAGYCVGYPLDGVEMKIIRISDEPIGIWNDSLLVPDGEIGEVAVKGGCVTREYLHRPRETAASKIPDADGMIWHRMGDTGYVDASGRVWFGGRKAHRVETEKGLMLPVQCEAIFNQHPAVARTALVGIGPMGRQLPVLCVEFHAGQKPSSAGEHTRLREELLALGRANPLTADIRQILFHPAFPMDVRHNAKIQREKLAVWAAEQIKKA